MLFLLKLFHPKYDYATVCEDNPQTIIWNKSFFKNTLIKTDTLPFQMFTDLRFLRTVVERLSDVSYEWTMNECPDIFQKASEEDLFAYLIACRS